MTINLSTALQTTRRQKQFPLSVFVFITDLKFRQTATYRTVTLAATAWGGTTSTWRKKQALSFSRGDGRRLFLTLLKGLRMGSLKEIRELLVYFFHYDGVISDEKFVPFEPICNLRIAKFSHAPQFVRLVIEPTQLLA